MLAIGEKYNRLTVDSEPISEWHSRAEVYYWCRCECGNRTHVRGNCLRSGEVKSCGCLARELRPTLSLTHGLNGTKLYALWAGMKARCYLQNTNYYHRYGGRGITVCEEWLNDPKSFCEWAEQNGYKKGLTLDRIDNNGNYEPNNCRWATPKQQARNTRKNITLTAWGETKLLMEWLEDERCKASYQAAYYRLKNGMKPEEALATEGRKKKV